MDCYKAQYVDLRFERSGLFKAMLEKYHPRNVLYPGCSVHVAPSLYFPHVVYVDRSEAAENFFAEESALLDFVNRSKHYKSPAYLRFLQQDYMQPLPLPEGTFDLVLSLFAGGIARSCARYLKPGGLLLTNNHQDDARDAARDPGLRLRAILQFRKGKYFIREEDPGSIKIPIEQPNNKYLRQTDQAVEYIENETYYVFARSRAS